MELYKRKLTYTDFASRTQDTTITATTLYFPILLTQNIEDIGYYNDTKNIVYESVDFSGRWDLSNNGVGQTPCLNLNNCTVNFTLNTPITYNGGNNGSLSVTIQGCPGPQTIQWLGPNGFTSNNLTVNNLFAGTYTVKVTDSNCNMTYASYYLTQPQALSLNLQSTNSQTNATTPGGCNGTINAYPLGGAPPYTYTWYSGNTIIAGPSTTITGLTSLCAGQYTVQIQDSTPAPNGPVISSRIVQITEPSPISGTVITTTNIPCSGGNTGSITVSAAGGTHVTGYTFNLTGPTNMTMTSTGVVTFNNLTAGNYTIQISDQAGNTTFVSSSITSSSPVTLNLTTTNTFVSSNTYDIGCFGSSKGNLTITPGGGSPPYTVLISQNGTPYSNLTLQNTNPYTLTNLTAGVYAVNIVTDGNGCSGLTKTINLLERPSFKVTVNPNSTINGYNIRCFGATTAITVNTSYTTSSVSFPAFGNNIKYYVDNVLKATVFGPSNNVTLTNISAGNHEVKVIDFFNCSASTTFTLTQPPSNLSFVGTPNIDIINVNPAVCTPACVTPAVCQQAIIGVNGGIAPYNIVWRMIPGNVAWGTGITSNPFCSSNSYTSLQVTVTDGNGCSITSSISV